jgi:hypothetical protein
MSIHPELEAQILRYYHVEKWGPRRPPKFPHLWPLQIPPPDGVEALAQR